MGLFRVLVRLFAGKGRPQSYRTTTEPLEPLSLRTKAEQLVVFRPQPVETVRQDRCRPQPVETVLQGRCHVIDGDTIVIKGIRIRLAGIDAPELDHPWGRQSKWALIHLCNGRTVTARFKPELSYNRRVAECFLPDGRDLAAELVLMGLALDWPTFSGGKYRHLEPQDVRRKLRRTAARQSSLLQVLDD